MHTNDNDNGNDATATADFYAARADKELYTARRALMARHADVMDVIEAIHRSAVASLVRDAVMSDDVTRWGVDMTREPWPAMLDAMAERALADTRDERAALDDLVIGVSMQAKVAAEWTID